MLHQTVYNTGELGRAFDKGVTGMQEGYSSLEWPPDSRMIIDRQTFAGHHNSFGGGMYLSGWVNGVVQTVACGAVTTTGTGQPIIIAGVYCDPGLIPRTENYPVLANGELNPLYNPNEAEEIIVADWTTRLMKIKVTRTSRAWSFPGYDCFIIHEYDLVNVDSVEITDAFIGWGYGLCPSMFGYERLYNEWSESNDMRSKDMYARFDLKRWMSYNHDRIGKPDTSFFDVWSQPGDRGGLDAPQAVGILPLHYDYEHLAKKSETKYPTWSDSTVVWDENGRLKQPYTNRYENANMDIAKISSWMDITARKTTAFAGNFDSASFPTQGLYQYWKGRAKPSWSLGWKQPAGHGYIFGPYKLPIGVHLHFTIAEIVGYGPGVAGDSIYLDLGGGTGSEATSGFHPVPSWYKQMTYADVGGTPPVIGSDYLQTHPLPWYVTPGVVSIRDVADRAIQMYTGSPLIKYDSLQFEPKNTPQTGVYNTVEIPIPAPMISIHSVQHPENLRFTNVISWQGQQVENFSPPRLKAPFGYYVILRAEESLGPWRRLDSVARWDPRYFKSGTYVFNDDSVNFKRAYFYAVISVDAQGGASGLTNKISHTTELTDVGRGDAEGFMDFRFDLGQNYPNPFNPTTTIRYHLPAGLAGLREKSVATLKIFDLLGRELATLVNEKKEVGAFTVRFDGSGLPSGMYFYKLEAGSFSQTRKMLLLK